MPVMLTYVISSMTLSGVLFGSNGPPAAKLAVPLCKTA
jgi:hypothetical protein